MTASLRIFRDAFEQSHDAQALTDDDGRVLAASKAFGRLTGYSAEGPVDRVRGLFAAERHEPGFDQRLLTQLRESGEWRGEIWYRRADQTSFLGATTVVLVRSGTGTHQLWLLRDLTDRGTEYDGNEYLASHDALTRLPNRLLLIDRLQRVCARTKRYTTLAALLILGVDGLRAVGESFGRNTADGVLAQAAERLRGAVRQSDTVARLDTEEFAIILNEIAQVQDAERVARTMLDHMARPFAVDGTELDIAACVGIAIMPGDGTGWTRVVRNADFALAAARRAGPATVRYFADTVA